MLPALPACIHSHTFNTTTHAFPFLHSNSKRSREARKPGSEIPSAFHSVSSAHYLFTIFWRLYTHRKMKRSRRAEFRKTLVEILEVLFAILIFIIFILAFVIQSDAIVLPPWTKTFQGATPEQQSQYSAALLSVIIVITALIVAAGAYLARSNA
ncbi:hypothetical protein F4782DRAFT_462525 [Xylaria castorea]|nr:hypothetical protein F4782DRAFT_462525 [Xylaria castorea]